MRVAILALVLVGSAAFAASGKVYKWTDSEGRVHFSNEKPRGGEKAEQMRMPSSPTPPPLAVGDAANSAGANASGPSGTKTGDLTDQQKSEMTRYCGELRARIAQLNASANNTGARLVEDSANGNVVLTQADIQERLQKDNQSLDTYCTANGL